MFSSVSESHKPANLCIILKQKDFDQFSPYFHKQYIELYESGQSQLCCKSN